MSKTAFTAAIAPKAEIYTLTEADIQVAKRMVGSHLSTAGQVCAMVGFGSDATSKQLQVLDKVTGDLSERMKEFETSYKQYFANRSKATAEEQSAMKETAAKLKADIEQVRVVQTPDAVQSVYIAHHAAGLMQQAYTTVLIPEAQEQAGYYKTQQAKDQLSVVCTNAEGLNARKMALQESKEILATLSGHLTGMSHALDDKIEQIRIIGVLGGPAKSKTVSRLG